MPQLGVVLFALLLVEQPAGADVLSHVFAGGGWPQPGGSGAPKTPPPDDLSSWAGPARAITLPALLQETIKQAPALANARIDTAIAEARIQQTYGRDDWTIDGELSGSKTLDTDLQSGAAKLDLGRLLPTGGTVNLHAETTYGRDLQLRLRDPINPADPFENVVVTTWGSGISATIAQPLFRGRGTFLYNANERRAVLARDAATLARRLAAIQAIQVVVSGYWDLVLAQRQVAITQASLDLARERLRITQIGNDGGKVPRSEIPAVQQIIATREEDVLTNELVALDRSIVLRRAAGMPIGQGELGLRVATELEIRDTTFDLGALTERAYAASPELAQLAKQDASTVIDIEVTENGLLPRLDAALTIGNAGSGTGIGSAWKSFGDFDAVTIAGALTFQHTIGQENVRGLAREQRENRKKIAVNAFDIRAQIALTMSRAVAQLELARRRIALSQRAIDLANENIKIEGDRFNLGKSTNFDVLNRQEELRQAEVRKAQAIIDWHKADTVVQALTTDILGNFAITVQ